MICPISGRERNLKRLKPYLQTSNCDHPYQHCTIESSRTQVPSSRGSRSRSGLVKRCNKIGISPQTASSPGDKGGERGRQYNSCDSWRWQGRACRNVTSMDLPLMTSARTFHLWRQQIFLTPLSPLVLVHATSLTEVSFFGSISRTPLPPSSADVINGSSRMQPRISVYWVTSGLKDFFVSADFDENYSTVKTEHRKVQIYQLISDLIIL